MSHPPLEPQPSPQEGLGLLNLAEAVLKALNLEALAQGVLPHLAALLDSPVALLYLAEGRLLGPLFSQTGLTPQAAASLERLCARQLSSLSRAPDLESVSVSINLEGGAVPLTLYPLKGPERLLGLLGVALPTAAGTPPFLRRALSFLIPTLDRFLAQEENLRRLQHLNTYLTVSTLIAQSLGLQELLENILDCCMDAVGAEAASIILLDEDKSSFRFYCVLGPARELLTTASLPADRGISGAILTSQQSEVINDVQHDPRFYARLDQETGFNTRNMVVVPLTAGEEKIGLLEVLNQTGGRGFIQEERLLLNSIAEEIAFAIRNAKIFDYVVNTYCKQRQGKSCKGCKRPLGSWTPCVKYREGEV